MVEPLAPAALADDLFLLDEIPDLEGGGWEGEEEELEWLSNKDAFPALETSFEVSGTGAEKETSPVSVLAAAALPLRVPVRARSERPRRRRRRALPVFPPAKRLAGGERRRCLHCETEDTPQWRAGPEGPKTLCNACGVRYKSGRLVPEYRPANSPTFSAFLHSNSHRRIMEMRRGGGGSGSATPRRRRTAAEQP